jgi:hypothetical protein
MIDFEEFPKISRYSREVIVTEKIDGTNAQILITEDGQYLTGSRTRWITPEDDNYGFSRWANENKEELLKLGVGRHFGEWWGCGIQRNYGLKEKRFSLFNTTRWLDKEPGNLPSCCSVVPVLWKGLFDMFMPNAQLLKLINNGSHAAPGFMKPEGIVIFHTVGNFGLKKTIEKDETPKTMQ